MHEHHDAATPPADSDILIWRYMDIPRLIALLTGEALWFGRADHQRDRHEGALGPASFNAWRTAFTSAGLSESDAKNYEQHRAYVADKISRTMFLNCWHMSDYESAAMWGMYVANGQGVAIRSTYSRLSESLTGPEPIFIGMVNYVDPRVEVVPQGNVLWPYLHKRRSFSYEQELRAICWKGREMHSSTSPLGFNIAVDVDRLIDAVFVAPGQPAWFHSVVTTVVQKLGHTGVSVHQSDLDVDPVF